MLRRCGFGGSPDEIQAFLDCNASVEEAVDEMLAFKPSAKKPPPRKDNSEESKLKLQRWLNVPAGDLVGLGKIFAQTPSANPNEQAYLGYTPIGFLPV